MDGVVIPTDQPIADGGDGSAPSPLSYFLASMGTCAGIYVLSFCQQRDISTDGLALTQRMEFAADESGHKRLSKVTLDIMLPVGFPEKYRNAIVKTAELCSHTTTDPRHNTLDSRECSCFDCSFWWNYSLVLRPRLCPETKPKLCTLCKNCAHVCPTFIITVDHEVTTKAENCVMCCACVKFCPQNARVMRHPLVETRRDMLVKNCSERKEPSCYV